MKTAIRRARRLRPIRREALGAFALRVLRDLFLLFFLVVNLFPLVWVLISSFKTNREILDFALKLPSSFSFQNYARVFEEPGMIRSFLNSALATVCSVLFNAAACYLASYAISRYEFGFLKVLLALLSFGLLIPINSALLPIKLIMDRLHLSNSIWGLSVLYAAFQIPISVMVLQSHIKGIPRSIDEAASIDGASPLNIALRIIAPIAKPGLVTIVILQAVSSWNEFLFAMTLISDQHKKTVQLISRNFLGLFQTNYGALFASVVLAVIPMIAVFLIFQNKVIEAFTAGSVKQ